MWRPRKARGIAPRFGGLLGPRHDRDAAIRFPRKPAHSGCCRTRRSRNPACLRGKLRRPTHPKMADLHSFGDYCRGDGPRAGDGTRILFKNNGAGTATQYRCALGQVTRPGQAPQAGQTSRPGKTRRLGPNNWRKTAEPGAAKASSPSQRHPWRATQSSRGSTPVPSRPNDGDETSINNDRSNSAPPVPLVSRKVVTVPLTYPLTGAGVATVPPPSPLTTASGNLTESTVHDSTWPCPDDRQDGAQSP